MLPVTGEAMLISPAAVDEVNEIVDAPEFVVSAALRMTLRPAVKLIDPPVDVTAAPIVMSPLAVALVTVIVPLAVNAALTVAL